MIITGGETTLAASGVILDHRVGLVVTPASSVSPFLKRGPSQEFLPETEEGTVLQVLSHIDDNNHEHWRNAKVIGIREVPGNKKKSLFSFYYYYYNVLIYASI
jgi:hypothetical protein